MIDNPPKPGDSPPTINWLAVILQISQRLISVAILAWVLIPAMLIFDGSERVPVATAYAGALIAGVIGGVLWFLPSIPKQERCEGRGLAIVALVILLLTIPLMKSNTVRSRLHGMQSKVSE